MREKKEKCRILVVDDDHSVLNAYRSVLEPGKEDAADKQLRELESKLFSSSPEENAPKRRDFLVTYCDQGIKAVVEVAKSIAENKPYALAFMDMRMPPGQDGLETSLQIRELDKLINIVIVTAYSDIHPKEIASKVQPVDRLLYLQKPFHSSEIVQFAEALSSKWIAEKKLLDLNAKLKEMVAARSEELELTIRSLREENEQRMKNESALKRAETRLRQRTIDLEATNTSIQVLSRLKEKDICEEEERIIFNINQLITPSLQWLQTSPLSEEQQHQVSLLVKNFKEVMTPFKEKISDRLFLLSPFERQVAYFIRKGKNAREIAKLLKTTTPKVESLTEQIRLKLNVKNSEANLRNVLRKFDFEE